MKKEDRRGIYEEILQGVMKKVDRREKGKMKRKGGERKKGGRERRVN